jgi:alpha-glucosidase
MIGKAPLSTIDTHHFVPLGQVRAMERTKHGVILSVGEERFRVDVIRKDILRLKVSQANRFDETPTAATCFEMPESPQFEVRQNDASITLTTESMELVISRQPFALAAYRRDGTRIFEDFRDGTGVPRGYLQLNDAFVVTRKIGAHDSIYGLGEKTGAFERRGRNFILWNTDVLLPDVLAKNQLHEADHSQTGSSTSFDPYYTSIPFFYHCTNGDQPVQMAGFFIDNGYKANFEFSERDVYRYKFAGGQYTEYVFAGPSMPQVLEAYTYVTGRMGAPPLWALGLHQCRFHDYTQETILKVGREYRKRDIPCDVLWLDIGYMNGYRVFTWDSQKFPDVSEMIERMSEDQLRLVTIMDPGVKLEPGFPVFEEGHARNLFCKTESGKPFVGDVWPGRTVFPDFSREEVRSWWADLNARHVAAGVAGIWNDMNEPATGGVEPFAMRFDRDGKNHPHERFHNQYGLLMAMGTHAGLLKAEPKKRPFILSRAGFSGIQRYAAQWTGDNQSEWGHLEMSVPMSMGLGVSGQAFVGSDIPGFVGKATGELSARWAQYGALTPFCRYHNHYGEADQYPWSFGNGVERRSRAAIELRYRLLPYIYTAFMKASETGAPVQRPLVFDFQHDRQARETDDCYLFGDALLVAPVFEAGRTARNVYLPDGTWIDWYTGQAYDGGQFITAAAPLDYIPLFAHGGKVVPTLAGAPMSTMGYYPDSIDLHLFVPKEDGEFVSHLHEDDGETHAFKQGAYLRTSLLVKRQGKRLSLSARCDGRGFPQFRRTQFRLKIHGAQAALIGDGGPTELRDFLVLDNRGQGFSLELQIS